jgi:type IV fimbrial biogenesis protein FimT
LLGHEQERLLMNHRLQQGFSIVEIVVVIGIFALLLSFAMPSISDLIANGRIRTAAEGVLNGIQLARAEAVRRNTPVELRIGADGVSWDIVIPVAGLVKNPDGTWSPATILNPDGTSTSPMVHTRAADGGSNTVCVSSGGTFAGAAPCTQSPALAPTTIRFDGWGTMAAPASFVVLYSSPVASNRAMCVAMISNTPRLCDPKRRKPPDGTDPDADKDPQACYSGGTFIAGC